MKKRNLTLIISIIAALALVVTVGLAVLTGTKQSGELMDVAAKRAGTPEAGAVYIEPDLTALAGALNGSPESKAAARQAFDQINAIRANNGLSSYAWSNGLEQAADVRAVEAVSAWSHTRPDGSDYWTVNANIVYGENLAKGFFGADSAVQGWMNSPTHKANILDAGFRTAGISINIAGDQWYWANEFGY